MSSSSETGSAYAAGADGSGSNSTALPPASGWGAAMELISSRIALIHLESKDAAKDGARRAVMLVIAIGCLFFGWILLLAGGVAWIAEAAGWPWYWVALGLAALHMILAIILVKLAKSSGNPNFPHTLAEFKKDRQWITNFQKTSKSSD